MEDMSDHPLSKTSLVESGFHSRPKRVVSWIPPAYQMNNHVQVQPQPDLMHFRSVPTSGPFQSVKMERSHLSGESRMEMLRGTFEVGP